MKIKQIITGFYYWVTGDNEELYQERTKECENCIFYRKFIIKRCGICNCISQAKNRVNDSICGMDKWKK